MWVVDLADKEGPSRSGGNSTRSMVGANDVATMPLRSPNAVSTATIRNPKPGEFELLINGQVWSIDIPKLKLLAFQAVDAITR